MAIECYTDVVKRLTGQKDNTMDLQALFNKKGNEQFLDIALELVARKDEVLYAHFSAIAREIESRYKEYRVDVWDNEKGISVRHSKFDEIKKFCFYIAAEIEKTSVYFKGYLENYNTEQTKKLTPKLKEILGVRDDDKVFLADTLEDDYLALKEFHKFELKDFTQERFINFFESVREKTDNFNQKIKDDLAKKDKIQNLLSFYLVVIRNLFNFLSLRQNL